MIVPINRHKGQNIERGLDGGNPRPTSTNSIIMTAV